MKHEIQTCIDCLQSAKCKYIRTIDYQAIGSNKIQRQSNEIRKSHSKYEHLFSRRNNHHTFGKRSAQFQCFPCCFCDLPIPLSSEYAGQVVIISVLEAKASRARGHSGHEAPPMTHSLVLTPTL